MVSTHSISVVHTVHSAIHVICTLTHQDIMLRDLRDEPYLRMEAKLRPIPDDSSGLELHQAAYDGELDSTAQKLEFPINHVGRKSVVEIAIKFPTQ